MIRLVLLLIVLGGLTLFALQNLSPAISLVFLGLTLPTLPLAVWILIAIAAGFFTSLLMGALFQLSHYLSEKSLRSRIRTLEAELASARQPRAKTEPASSTSYSYTGASSSYKQAASTTDNDFEDEADEEPGVSNQTVYERPQEPKTQFQSGSVYSYSYREDTNTGVGKTEDVYDAEYRVITPPYQPPNPVESQWKSPSNEEDDEDWGFDDDDEFDDETPRSGK